MPWNREKQQKAAKAEKNTVVPIVETRQQAMKVQRKNRKKSQNRIRNMQLRRRKKNAETQKIQNAEPISEGVKLDMNPPEEQTEIVEKSITRKEYFDSLTAWGVAVELAKAVRTTLKTADLAVEENWGEWLKRKVDYQGRDLEEEIEQEG